MFLIIFNNASFPFKINLTNKNLNYKILKF